MRLLNGSTAETLLTTVACSVLWLGTPTIGLCQTQSTPPANGLVGWWQGNGDANDSSGNGHNGMLQGGMGFTSGVNGGLAFAAGSNRRVFVPDSPAFELTSMTMAAWVKPSAFGYYIFFRGDERVGLDPYALGLNGASQVGIEINDATNNAVNLFSPAPIPYNAWTHVAATFDGTSGDMKVFLNGVLVAETNTVIKPLLALDPSQTPGLGIGNTESTVDFPFQGAIEQVLLYSRALSSAEIQQIYQMTACSPHAATATAQVVNGFVVGAMITDSGCGYTNTPSVLITGGGGSGATATATVSNGVVAGITITGAGIGYTNVPAILIGAPLGLQIGLVKAVKPSFFNLSPGANYQLQVSSNFNNWSTQQLIFTATNTSMVYPQYFDVDNFDQLFFRLQSVP